MDIFASLHTEADIAKLKKHIARTASLRAELLRVREGALYTKGGKRKTTEFSVPSTAELRQLYTMYVREGRISSSPRVEDLLKKMRTKSNSGVAVVSVLTMPYRCPGRCTYCPFDARMPKSYLSDEPAAARALATDFDPYIQVHTRLRALVANGHPVDKVEMIVIGGTWSYYGPIYQEEFMIGLYRACNDWGTTHDSRGDHYEDRLTYLRELQLQNETASARMIGLSIETRPDYITHDEIARLRVFGVTKVELGVQHLDNAVLERVKRDMTIESVAEATELLRDAGFKMVYHMMPNLPGSTPERDISMFYDLFHDSRFHPDMLKIYPCAVLAGTQLYEEYIKGEHTAYSDEVLGRVLAGAKKEVPSYVRIQRVVRDIPATHIVAGSKLSNFRELIKKDMREYGWQCQCIRCREVREDEILPEQFELIYRTFTTIRGQEYFLSFETPDRKKLASFIRLRIPHNMEDVLFPELHGAALVRELHTYGIHTRVGDNGTQAQHVGFGRRLVARAEEIALEHGCHRVAIISGVGVRKYYEKLGYHLEGTYMVKEV